MKRAIVTGAYGFVGRHLIPRLVAEGYQVQAIDSTAAKFETTPEVKCHSYTDAAILHQLRFGKDTKVDLVVHLAANILDIDKRMSGGISNYSDVALDYNVCQWVENLKPKCFIAMSSCAVDYIADPYCIVKRNLEAMATTLHKNGQKTIILRPFSGYGYDQSDTYPFPSILKRAHKKADPLVVWGGNQKRDWIHIDDFVDGVVYSIDHFPSGQPVELGTCRSITFYELARTMAAVVGYDPTVLGDKDKPSSSPERRAGLSGVHVAQRFGWVRKITIEQGIEMEYKKLLSSLK